MIPDLRTGSAVSGKVIYRWKREEIKRRMVKSGSPYLDVVRQFQGSRNSRMRAFSLRIALFQIARQSRS